MLSTSPTDDVRIDEIRALLSPTQVIAELAPSTRDITFVLEARRETEKIIQLQDPRLLVVLGPCSIHEHGAAMEYAELVKQAAGRFADDLCLIMRVYFEKPRTTVGWKGYINDPGLDESFDINRGLRLARELLLDVIRERVATGTEFLDTISPQYIADLVVWGAIGARTVESQVHRELASGLSMPVGFKNGTGGGIGIAIDAIRAALHPHHFLSVTKEGKAAIVKTRGNDMCHIILRGGKSGPNYTSDHVAQVAEQLTSAKLAPSIMVDCSHGNSSKDHRNQRKVAANVADQIRDGQRAITGVMIESNLVAGRQDVAPGSPLTRGQSITDACIDWPETAAILEDLARAISHRRKN